MKVPGSKIPGSRVQDSRGVPGFHGPAPRAPGSPGLQGAGQGCRVPRSRVPGFQNSMVPGLQGSRVPGRVPGFQVPGFQGSIPDFEGCKSPGTGSSPRDWNPGTNSSSDLENTSMYHSFVLHINPALRFKKVLQYITVYYSIFQ